MFYRKTIMEESFFLILLCLVMLGGSYFAGLIPLVVSLSEVRNERPTFFMCMVALILTAFQAYLQY